MLFPDQLQAGVTIARGPVSGADAGASSTDDGYVIGIPETRRYAFHLIGDDLPAGTQLTVTDASGQSILLSPTSDPQVFNAFLGPGTYTVSVGRWSVQRVCERLLPAPDPDGRAAG